jgi:hypothetical protein
MFIAKAHLLQFKKYEGLLSILSDIIYRKIKGAAIPSELARNMDATR